MLYIPLQVGLPPAKNTKFIVTTISSFKLRMHQNHFSAGALPRTPLGDQGELTTLPRPPSRLGRGQPLPLLSARRFRRLDFAAIHPSSKRNLRQWSAVCPEWWHRPTRCDHSLKLNSTQLPVELSWVELSWSGAVITASCFALSYHDSPCNNYNYSLYLNLSKLCPKYCRSLFPGYGHPRRLKSPNDRCLCRVRG